jgi:hypothetical protein
MSTIIKKKVAALGGCDIKVEVFASAHEVVEVSNGRKITNSNFNDERSKERENPSWTGVANFAEAQRLMKEGYQPTVDKMKDLVKTNVRGEGKRYGFRNEVAGFAPIVPLALQGIPNCMQNTYMKPIKTKVLDVYYDMTASCGTASGDLIKAGQKLLGAILELEAQGYRFNLWATQGYYDGNSADMLCVKIKNSNTPLDLKRMSFPLTHTGFFRVIGFDWYSRFPEGTFRWGYGHAMSYDFAPEKMTKGYEELFGRKAVVFSASKIIKDSKEHIKEVLENAGNNK